VLLFRELPAEGQSLLNRLLVVFDQLDSIENQAHITRAQHKVVFEMPSDSTSQPILPFAPIAA